MSRSSAQPAPCSPQEPSRGRGRGAGILGFRYCSAPIWCRCSAATQESSCSTRRPSATSHPLQDAIGDVEWVLHAASQDLPSLRELHLEPPVIFDTELVLRLLGHERVGLGAVVEDTLGITLKKEHSAADWSTRPLPDSWLEYAALDVLHLIDVRDVLVLELEEQGKTEFAAQEFAATLARAPKPPREDPWRRLSGLHQVRGARTRFVARSLWQAREAFAQDQDVSPDASSPTVPSWRRSWRIPRRNRHWQASRSSRGAGESYAARSVVAGDRRCCRASEDPSRTRPERHSSPPRAWADRNPEADARLKAARRPVEAAAEELGMPTENLLTRSTSVAWPGICPARPRRRSALLWPPWARDPGRLHRPHRRSPPPL